ncbi:MAG TPA: choice-of-anchor tandem repeat GloVer-containing protein [Terriglobia bacterium]
MAVFAILMMLAASAVPAQAQIFTILHSFDYTDGAEPAAALFQASPPPRSIAGDLFGTTLEGGPHVGGTVFQITPSGTLTTAYNFCSKSGCTDGEYPGAGLVQSTDGTLYGTTSQGGSLRRRHGLQDHVHAEWRAGDADDSL